MYGIYSEWNDADKSQDYAEKSITFAKLSGNKNLLANGYSALSVAYTYRYEQNKEQQYLDSVMHLLDAGILLYQQYPGQVLHNTYSMLHINKASYYQKYYNQNDNHIKQQIRNHVREAMLAAQETSGNEAVVASGYGILSELSLQEQDLQSAENYLLLAYTMMVQKKSPYYHTLINVLQSLVKINVQKGDFQKAFDNQQEITKYSRILFNEESEANAKRLEAQFDFTKKEQEIQLLKEQTESHRKQKQLLIGLIAIGLVGAFFMFRSYHFNLKYSLAREKQLTAEKNESVLQIKYEKEEQARLKAEQELLELQQQKLQDEVLLSQLQLRHKSEVLQQVKERLTTEDTDNLKQILREETLVDGDFERTKFHIQELHPNFFQHLTEQAQQKLTLLDQKYCAYLYFGMETKQIALLLNVEPKSVRMAKYRLKQKFNLNSETDLVDYLKGIG